MFGALRGNPEVVDEQFAVEVPADVAARARKAIDRMMEIGR